MNYIIHHFLVSVVLAIRRIQYEVSDEPLTDEIVKDYPILNDSLGIYFEFKEPTYKELKHVRSMDGQALIGKETLLNVTKLTII